MSESFIVQIRLNFLKQLCGFGWNLVYRDYIFLAGIPADQDSLAVFDILWPELHAYGNAAHFLF